MATITAYQALQDKVSADNQLITDLTQKISDLKNDTVTNNQRAILAVVGPGNDWIDGGTTAGTRWTGIDAQGYNRSAQARIAKQDADIILAQGQLSDAKAQLIIDTKAVTDYETNSPTVKAQIQSELQKSLAQTAASAAEKAQAFVSANQKTLVTVVILFVVVVIGVIIFKRKNKKTVES